MLGLMYVEVRPVFDIYTYEANEKLALDTEWMASIGIKTYTQLFDYIED